MMENMDILQPKRDKIEMSKLRRSLSQNTLEITTSAHWTVIIVISSQDCPQSNLCLIQDHIYVGMASPYNDFIEG